MRGLNKNGVLFVCRYKCRTLANDFFVQKSDKEGAWFMRNSYSKTIEKLKIFRGLFVNLFGLRCMDLCFSCFKRTIISLITQLG